MFSRLSQRAAVPCCCTKPLLPLRINLGFQRALCSVFFILSPPTATSFPTNGRINCSSCRNSSTSGIVMLAALVVVVISLKVVGVILHRLPVVVQVVGVQVGVAVIVVAVVVVMIMVKVVLEVVVVIVVA